MEEHKLPVDEIIQGDCLQVLSTIPECSVDLIFADPPYNLQLRGDLWRPNMTKVEAVDEDWDRFASFEEYDRFTRAWLAGCRRVLKDTGTIWVIGTYHNIYRVGAILQDLGYWILNDVVWIKSNPMPNFRGVRFTNAHETLIWAQKERGKRYTFNHHAMKALNGDLQMRSDWYLPLCTGKERIKVNGSKAHSTQKPEALLYRVILSNSNVGDVILDPFFGTGTTGAVARKLSRHWVGIEQDVGYIRIARERIAAVKPLEEVDLLSTLDDRRTRYRISFATILESGLLQPGQILYFDHGSQEVNGSKNPPAEEITATILANGHIRCKEFTGSIHQVGKTLLNSPCNGWKHWYFLDEATGERVFIDRLRQKMMDGVAKGE